MSAQELERPKMPPRLIAGAFLGSVLEGYDFVIYGLAAGLVFGELYFSNLPPFAATIVSLLTFAVGFIGRPLGGIFFGRLGDVVGRKPVSIITLIVTGLSTLLIGLLPSYQTIGVAAPILLVLFRFIQGVGFGGELGGVLLLSVESAPPNRRGLAAGMIWGGGVPGGTLLATGVFGLMQYLLPHEEFREWGWRVPFIIGGLIVVVALFLRSGISETHDFLMARENRVRVKSPIREAIATQMRPMLQVAGMRMAQNGYFYVMVSFSAYYVAKVLGRPVNLAIAGITIGSLVSLFITLPFFSYLTDRIGRKPVYLAGVIGSAIWTWFLFEYLSHGSDAMVVASIVIGILLHDLMFAPTGAWFTEIYPVHLRSTSFALPYNIASILAGGLSPLIAASLLKVNHNDPTYVVLYMTGLCVISTAAALWAVDSYGASLSRVGRAAREDSVIRGAG